MTVKKFHSRRSDRRMFLWGGICLFLVSLGLLAADITGSTVLIVIAAVLVVPGSVWIAVQGRKDIIEYVLGGDALLLRRGAEEERLPLAEVVDANLIDLTTARDFVQQQGNSDDGPGPGQAQGPRRSSTRYCGVPIASGRLGSVWVGLSGLSSRSFRRDFVLLRIRDGGMFLLSPKYSERMVTAIDKAKGIDL